MLYMSHPALNFSYLEFLFPDVTFLTLPEGCPYSIYNDPLFPEHIHSIEIAAIGFESDHGRLSPKPGFANFFPGTNFTSCVTLTVVDDEEFENSEMFVLSINGTGPDIYLPITEGQDSTLITINDPEGEHK